MSSSASIIPNYVVRSQHPSPHGKRKTEVFEVFRYLFMRLFMCFFFLFFLGGYNLIFLCVNMYAIILPFNGFPLFFFYYINDYD